MKIAEVKDALYEINGKLIDQIPLLELISYALSHAPDEALPIIGISAAATSLLTELNRISEELDVLGGRMKERDKTAES